jgi:hypothetical protein
VCYTTAMAYCTHRFFGRLISALVPMKWLRRIARSREIYFHEDDQCQQEFLPTEGAHRGADLRTARITKEQLEATLGPLLPLFDAVYTGYGSHRERCTKTAAWGASERCVLLADWDDARITRYLWANFFDPSEEAILRATQAVAALGALRPLIYGDWAWGYQCAASDSDTFASLLRGKLRELAAHAGPLKKG